MFIASVRALLGPDQYAPFIAITNALGWSLPKILRVVLPSGSGHLVGSVALGILGIAAGIELTRLKWIESQGGQLAAWALCMLGALSCAWVFSTPTGGGLRQLQAGTATEAAAITMNICIGVSPIVSLPRHPTDSLTP